MIHQKSIACARNPRHALSICQMLQNGSLSGRVCTASCRSHTFGLQLLLSIPHHARGFGCLGRCGQIPEWPEACLGPVSPGPDGAPQLKRLGWGGSCCSWLFIESRVSGPRRLLERLSLGLLLPLQQGSRGAHNLSSCELTVCSMVRSVAAESGEPAGCLVFRLWEADFQAGNRLALLCTVCALIPPPLQRLGRPYDTFLDVVEDLSRCADEAADEVRE